MLHPVSNRAVVCGGLHGGSCAGIHYADDLPLHSWDHSDRATRPPSTLVVGDSIMRNIKHRSAVTCSLSGAKVSDITQQLPSLLDKYHYIQKVVIHVDCNDIRDQSTELL